MNRNDDDRIRQLTSRYDPFTPPQLPLDFGDYLSIVWRIDRHADQPHLETYYRHCERALARAFGFEHHSLGRMVRTIQSGQLYAQLGNVPFQTTGRLGDAAGRKAAIQQLAALRSDVLAIGAYQHDWVVGWPGSSILDPELRERVYATLFTALRGQYAHFGRLLLVMDIVLEELLLGTRGLQEISLGTLIDRYDYPDPEAPAVRHLYQA